MQNSLRFRLTIMLVILAVGPLLLAGGIIAQRAFAFEQSQAFDLQDQVARNASAEVDAVFIDITDNLVALGNEIRSLQNPDQAQQLSLMLNAISSGSYREFYDELTLLNKYGREIVRISPDEITRSTDLTDRSHLLEFTEPARTGSIYYSPVSTDINTGKSHLMIAIPLYASRSTDLGGILIANINTEPIGNVLGKIRSGNGQIIYLVSSNGTMLAHQDRAQSAEGAQIQLPNTVTIQDGLNSEDVIIAPSKVRLGEQTLYVIAEKQTALALEIAYTIINTIVIVILIAIVIAVALGNLVIRQVVVPIEGLASLAGQVAQGDLTLTASVKSRDEIGILASAFNTMTAQLRGLIEGLEKGVSERTKDLQNRTEQLEAIADVARSIATLNETEQLLTDVTSLISKRFGFYHVGIFLLDHNKEYAILRAANSEGGYRMLLRGHRLKVGEQGIVGFVTSRGQPRIASNVGSEAVYFNNPDLPETQSEFSLPLKFGQEIIGALDIQSKGVNAFSQADVEIFAILADQVSVALQNARSLEQAQRALRDAEIATSQLTSTAWKTYTEKAKNKGYHYDGIQSEPLKAIAQKSTGKNTMSIPVQLRGQTIGRLKLIAPDQTRKWTDDELAILNSTAERVAIAVESARLLEDAQKRAARETLLSEISSKLGSSFQLDSIIRDTVEELGQKLTGSTISFQLMNPASASQPDNSGKQFTKRIKPE